MSELIHNFLNLYAKSDIDTLNFIHPKLKGFRSVDGTLLFDTSSLSEHIANKNKVTISDVKVQKFDTYLIVDMDQDSKPVTMKIEVKDSLIYKVYEVEKLLDKKRIKCIVQYDGSMFFGYQKQPNQTTIQSTIEDAIKSALNEEVIIHSSGRTDKGVHAYNQVIHFDTKTSIPGNNIYKLINKALPDAINIKSSEEVHETFHSRYDILFKEYVYIINKKEFDVTKRNYEWFVPNIDTELLRDELKSLLGTHDFASFTKTTDKDTIRTIFDIRLEEDETYIKVFIKGNGFLRYMVRNIIAYSVHVVTGKTNLTLQDILAKKDNSVIKDIAPAGGLYMNEVKYYE